MCLLDRVIPHVAKIHNYPSSEENRYPAPRAASSGSGRSICAYRSTLPVGLEILTHRAATTTPIWADSEWIVDRRGSESWKRLELCYDRRLQENNSAGKKQPATPLEMSILPSALDD
jgi:hypothetical protein